MDGRGFEGVVVGGGGIGGWRWWGTDRDIGSRHGLQRKMQNAAARANVWVGGRLRDGSRRPYWNCRNAALCNLTSCHWEVSSWAPPVTSSERTTVDIQDGNRDTAQKSIPHFGRVFGCFTWRLVDRIRGTSHATQTCSEFKNSEHTPNTCVKQQWLRIVPKFLFDYFIPPLFYQDGPIGFEIYFPSVSWLRRSKT